MMIRHGDCTNLLSWEVIGDTYVYRFADKYGNIDTVKVNSSDLLKYYMEDRSMKEGITGPTGPLGDIGHVVEKPIPVRNERGSILDKAKKIINGQRQDMYGTPEDNFELIARLWTLYLQKRYNKPDSFTGYLTKEDVGIMMTYMKMARLTSGHHMKDSFVDACGYLAITADFGTINEDDVPKD